MTVFRHVRTGALASVAVLASALTSPVLAQAPKAAARALSVPYVLDSLPNGLTLIVHEDHSTPIVTTDVWFHVGSGDEKPGRTGFAHLFEHLMFMGSEHAENPQFDRLLEAAGANNNGSTTEDRTNYYESGPSSALPLMLWLEADRMGWLLPTMDKPKVDLQRDVVKNERRQSYENQPYGLVADYEPKLMYPAGHPYSWPVIGSMADLSAASVDDVKNFFRQYYAPNNASLVVAGDFVAADAKRLIEQYFADVPRVAAPPRVACEQAFNTGPLRRTVTDKNATLAASVAFFRVPEEAHADHPAIELLSTILGQGESSRLNRSVVRDTKAAAAAQTLGLYGPTRGPNAFAVLAIANQGVAVDSVEKLVAAQIARIAADGVTEAELAKAKNAFRANKIMERETALNVAESVHYAETFLGDPLKVNTDLARYGAVTVADIKRVAAQYLQAANSLVLMIVPPEAK